MPPFRKSWLRPCVGLIDVKLFFVSNGTYVTVNFKVNTNAIMQLLEEFAMRRFQSFFWKHPFPQNICLMFVLVKAVEVTLVARVLTRVLTQK